MKRSEAQLSVKSDLASHDRKATRNPFQGKGTLFKLFSSVSLVSPLVLGPSRPGLLLWLVTSHPERAHPGRHASHKDRRRGYGYAPGDRTHSACRSLGVPDSIGFAFIPPTHTLRPFASSEQADFRSHDAPDRLITRKFETCAENGSKFYLVIMSRFVPTFRHKAWAQANPP